MLLVVFVALHLVLCDCSAYDQSQCDSSYKCKWQNSACVAASCYIPKPGATGATDAGCPNECPSVGCTTEGDESGCLCYSNEGGSCSENYAMFGTCNTASGCTMVDFDCIGGTGGGGDDDRWDFPCEEAEPQNCYLGGPFCKLDNTGKCVHDACFVLNSLGQDGECGQGCKKVSFHAWTSANSETAAYLDATACVSSEIAAPNLCYLLSDGGDPPFNPIFCSHESSKCHVDSANVTYGGVQITLEYCAVGGVPPPTPAACTSATPATCNTVAGCVYFNGTCIADVWTSVALPCSEIAGDYLKYCDLVPSCKKVGSSCVYDVCIDYSSGSSTPSSCPSDCKEATWKSLSGCVNATRSLDACFDARLIETDLLCSDAACAKEIISTPNFANGNVYVCRTPEQTPENPGGAAVAVRVPRVIATLLLAAFAVTFLL